MERESTATATATNGGVGLFGFLGLLFIALKLTGFIDWSWWWVTAPLWLPSTVVGVFVLVGFVILLGHELRGKR